MRKNISKWKYTVWILLVTIIVGFVVWFMDASRLVNNQLTKVQEQADMPISKTLTDTADVVLAGDIANDNGFSFGAELTSKLINSMDKDIVLPLGDLIYNDNYKLYDRTWGQFKDISYPARGNHDNLPIYDEYWGSDKVATSNDNNYSFDSVDKNWHFVSLNSNLCNTKRSGGGCTANSAVYVWLAGDLLKHQSQNTLVYWHHPRFSSFGPEPNNNDHYDNDFMEPVWQLLVSNKVDIVATGHVHTYERYKEKTDGIRYFQVGTGGTSPNICGSGGKLGLPEVCTPEWGVVGLQLGKNEYSWQFNRALPGIKTLDSGHELVNR